MECNKQAKKKKIPVLFVPAARETPVKFSNETHIQRHRKLCVFGPAIRKLRFRVQ